MSEPLSVLFNYGAVGVMAVLLVYVVKRLYEQNTNNYDARLADKDRQIADKDAMVERLLDVLGNHVAPAMAKTAEVIKAVPPPADTLLLAKVEELVSHLEGQDKR